MLRGVLILGTEHGRSLDQRGKTTHMVRSVKRIPASLVLFTKQGSAVRYVKEWPYPINPMAQPSSLYTTIRYISRITILVNESTISTIHAIWLFIGARNALTQDQPIESMNSRIHQNQLQCLENTITEKTQTLRPSQGATMIRRTH